MATGSDRVVTELHWFSRSLFGLTGAGPGAGGGALTAMSAAKAGVAINAMAAKAVASFFMTAPENGNPPKHR